jgi:hypothetical protein
MFGKKKRQKNLLANVFVKNIKGVENEEDELESVINYRKTVVWGD